MRTHHEPRPVPEALLSADDEIELARAIEAGLIAAEALGGRFRVPAGTSTPELTQLVAEGHAAWRRMWLANMGLVRMLAHREGRTLRAPADDLMQEGCLGLAQAIMRWDYRRGTRFSTVAWPWIENRLRRCVREHQQGAALGHEVPDLADPHSLELELTRDALPVWLPSPHGPQREVLVSLARGEDPSARAWAQRWGVSTSTARRIKLAAFQVAREAWQRNRAA